MSRYYQQRIYAPLSFIFRLKFSQLLAMENERFSVPEVLFRPSDIGIDQAGVAETAAQSIIALW